jgi:2,5-diketo-D-gluconate reductase B
VFVAYSPLAQGRYFDDPALAGIAKAHQRKVSQVMLRWLVQQDGVAAIPKASSQAHLLDNISIFDFSLGDDEMLAIAELMRPSGRFVTPGFSPQWDS